MWTNQKHYLLTELQHDIRQQSYRARREDRMRGEKLCSCDKRPRQQSHHPWEAAAKLKYVHVKVYWYGIRFDICLGAQCYRIIWSPQNTQHKKAMRLHTHTHIHQERKLAEEAWLGNSTADRTCTKHNQKRGTKYGWLKKQTPRVGRAWSMCNLKRGARN